MSASSTPKGTPVQRSPSDGLPVDVQSPQHSTPGSGAQQNTRISSLLQSPVRGLFASLLQHKNHLHLMARRVSSSFDPPSWQEHVCLCVQSFREELDVLIQEQMKKGGSSSNLWALRQLADFMATHGSPAALPVSLSSKGK